MNTERNPNPQSIAIFDYRLALLISSTIVVVGVCFVGILAIESRKREYKLENAELVEAIKTYENAKGLPATVENLREGTVYFVSAVISNQRPDETEHFAVLHKVTVANDSDYRHSREEQFFMLPFPLEPHKYYQFSRLGTGKIARAEEYPPPTPR